MNKKTTVYIEEEKLKQLKVHCYLCGKSFNGLVNELLDTYIDTLVLRTQETLEYYSDTLKSEDIPF